MTEESILILNMLREGKISAEQADSLLRAVRENGPAATPPPPAAAPPPAGPDSAAMAAMQAKLAELQGKLGDLQGKLGAAQTARATDYASALAGRLLDNIPKPDLDMGKINKAVDEAMRGLNSLKNDALRTAKTAARQASQEARRAGRESSRALKFGFNGNPDGGTPAGRPENAAFEPQALQTSTENITWTGANTLILHNNHGGVTILGMDLPAGTAEATVTKTAWAGSESEARILLQQVFLTHQVESGHCKIGIAVPSDAGNRLTVDYEIRVPRETPLEVFTTHGSVTAQGVSSALTAQSASGTIHASAPWASASGETRIRSQSGNVQIHSWEAPSGSLSVETGSGGIDAADVSSGTISLHNRSGDIAARNLQAGASASLETTSGDVELIQSAATARVQVRSQSGQARVVDTRAEQLHLETVSGDAEVRGVSGAITAKTISGDVRAFGTDSAAVSLVTVSGDALWQVSEPFSGSFAGTTVSGDLRLELPAGSDARLEMNTTSGALALLLPVPDAVSTDRHTVGVLGSGTGSIRLQSVSGDLTLAQIA